MGLVKYLDNPASEVVSMAARAIWLLSSSPGNTPSLMKQAGLFDKLVRVVGQNACVCTILAHHTPFITPPFQITPTLNLSHAP